DLWLVAPDLLAGLRVYCVDDAPIGGAIENAVGIKRSRLLTGRSARPDFIRPGEGELADILRVYLRHRAVALFAPTHSVTQPFRALRRILQRAVVHFLCLQRKRD